MLVELDTLVLVLGLKNKICVLVLGLEDCGLILVLEC